MPGGEKIADKRVLFVMAVEAEYGPQLKARFDPLMTGVGPVEAALNTGLALQRLDMEGALPDLVVSLGSAGSRICTLGEVYQVASVSWRDMDASRLGPDDVRALAEQRHHALEDAGFAGAAHANAHRDQVAARAVWCETCGHV